MGVFVACHIKNGKIVWTQQHHVVACDALSTHLHSVDGTVAPEGGPCRHTRAAPATMCRRSTPTTQRTPQKLPQVR